MCEEPLLAALQSRLEPLIAGGQLTGVAAALVQGSDGATLRLGRRHANLTERPDLHDVFEIGSITKTFTATLLVDAVRRGEVSYHDRMDRFLPTGIQTGSLDEPVTLLHLATHTSGLPRLPPNLRWQALLRPWNPYARYRTEQLERAAACSCQPGRYAYSNFGYGLLGLALERAAGLPFARLVGERICEPLHLTETWVGSPPGAKLVEGHRRGRPVPHWDVPTLAGAGGIRSTLADMTRYLRAHLAPDSSALGGALMAVRELRIQIDDQAAIGLAWHLQRTTADTVAWHNGGTGGFSSFIALAPAADTGVVILANTASLPDSPVDRTGMELLAALSGR